MTTETASLSARVPSRLSISALFHLARLERTRALVATWRQRDRERRELAHLSAFDLKDIGYPAEAAAERSKPFWQP